MKKIIFDEAKKSWLKPNFNHATWQLNEADFSMDSVFVPRILSNLLFDNQGNALDKKVIKNKIDQSLKAIEGSLYKGDNEAFFITKDAR